MSAPERRWKLRAVASLTTFDMADHYGSAEDIAGLLVEGSDATRDIQIATKWVPEPGPVTRQGVRAAIERALGRLRSESIDLLQFHGTEDPAYCEHFARPYIKALGMGGLNRDGLVKRSKAYKNARGLLLDSHEPGAAGGSGEIFDWNSIPALNKPVILAGGLTVDNVAEAVARVRPWAVDVSSGVEISPGKKDSQKIEQFIQAVVSLAQ